MWNVLNVLKYHAFTCGKCDSHVTLSQNVIKEVRQGRGDPCVVVCQQTSRSSWWKPNLEGQGIIQRWWWYNEPVKSWSSDVTYFTKDFNPSLAKPPLMPLNFNGGLAELGLTFLVKQGTMMCSRLSLGELYTPGSIPHKGYCGGEFIAVFLNKEYITPNTDRPLPCRLL